MKEYAISLYLDTRREKGANMFPLKLKVYSTALQKAKLYTTGLDLS